jgi:hypothetical protein
VHIPCLAAQLVDHFFFLPDFGHQKPFGHWPARFFLFFAMFCLPKKQ